MTAAAAGVTDADAAVSQPDPVLASYGERAGALVVDIVFGAVATVAVVVLVVMSVPVWAVPWRSWQWWLFTAIAALIIVAVVANRWFVPAWTGWSLGRAVNGIRVVTGEGGRVGAPLLIARDCAQLLDTAAVFVGWLWPLWDVRHRTFADILLRTEVHRVGGGPTGIRRQAGVLLVAVSLVCVTATGLAYLTIYRHERAVEIARTQIAADGPRIVEQMLSYGPDTAKDDFARAQRLVTDNYRPELIAQQRALQKVPLTANDYWSVGSAVLADPPVTVDTASMVVALRGQRGVEPKDQKPITATVRVDYVKSGGQWRVQNLTVLAKPQPSRGAR